MTHTMAGLIVSPLVVPARALFVNARRMCCGMSRISVWASRRTFGASGVMRCGASGRGFQRGTRSRILAGRRPFFSAWCGFLIFGKTEAVDRLALAIEGEAGDGLPFEHAFGRFRVTARVCWLQPAFGVRSGIHPLAESPATG